MNDNLVAVTGMSCRFPGASCLDEFWQLISSGQTMIQEFSSDEREAHPQFNENEIPNDWVYSGATLDRVSEFDADFFGYSPKEAALMDPQHRLALQLSWHALENACLVPSKFPGDIGVFFGASLSTYLINNLLRTDTTTKENGGLSFLLHNDKDHIATNLSYKFGLTGPSMSIGSGCSSSLSAIHQAYFSLLTFQCDAAIAGGASILLPQKAGYQFVEGGVYSKEGKCVPFAEESTGTVGGSGLGVVVLKRLEDAIKDGDRIYSVIAGSACLNDGNKKVGYTAPSIEGQAKAIADALDMADISLEQVQYIEAHGTGTSLGDPIEVSALKSVSNKNTNSNTKCYLGSVKANIGHLDAASGIAGFIKSSLILHKSEIPKQISPYPLNHRLELDNTQFDINEDSIRLNSSLDNFVCTNSLGMGGTNVFTVQKNLAVYNPECRTDYKPETRILPFPISAKSKSSLKSYALRLAQFLMRNDVQLRDVSYSLINTREMFDHRCFVQASDIEQLIERLTSIGDEDICSQSLSEHRTFSIANIGQANLLAIFSQKENCNALFDEVLNEVISESSFSSYEQFISNLIESNDDLLALLIAELIINIYTFRKFEANGIVFDRVVSKGVGDIIAGFLVGCHDVKLTISLFEIVVRELSNFESHLHYTESKLFESIAFNQLLRKEFGWKDCAEIIEIASTSEVEIEWVSSISQTPNKDSFLEQVLSHIKQRQIIKLPTKLESELDGIDIHKISNRLKEFSCCKNDLAFLDGIIWEHGGSSDLSSNIEGKKICLPNYYFENNHYWFDADGTFKFSDVTGGGNRLEYLLTEVSKDNTAVREFSGADIAEWRLLVSKFIASLWNESFVPTFKVLERFRIEEFTEYLGINEKYLALISDVFRLLVEHGYLLENGSEYEASESDRLIKLDRERCKIIERFPKQSKYIKLLEQLIPFYQENFKHESLNSHLTRFFEKTKFTRSLESLTEYSESFDFHCKQLCQVVNNLSKHKNRPIRILEIGCGHLMLTKHIVESVDLRLIESYCLTDVNEDFLQRAKLKSQSLGIEMVSCEIFDINRCPSEQGFLNQEFDIIIGINVFHLANNDKQTFGFFESILCNDGYICQIDLLNVDESHNLIWGIYDEWWGPSRSGKRASTLYNYDSLIDTLHGEFVDWRMLGDRANVANSSSVLWIAKGNTKLTADDASVEANDLLYTHKDVKDWIYLENWESSYIPFVCEESNKDNVIICVNSKEAIDYFSGIFCSQRITWLYIDSANLTQELCSASSLEKELSRDIYRVNSKSSQEIRNVLVNILEERKSVSKVIYALNIYQSSKSENAIEAFASERWGTNSLLPFHDVVSVLAAYKEIENIQLCLITQSLYSVLGNEEINPGFSLSASLVKSLAVECPQIALAHVDLPKELINVDAELLLSVINESSEEPQVIRGKRVWKKRYSRKSSATQLTSELDFNDKTIVLIGGLGGIGLAIAKYLSTHYSVNIIIIHRNNSLKKDDINSLLDCKELRKDKRSALKLVISNAKSLSLQYADITKQNELDAVIREIQNKFSSVDFVLHLAGSIDREGIILTRNRDRYLERISNKTVGIHNSLKKFECLSPKKHVVFSSLGAVLYKAKFGESAYIMANDYLNSFSRMCHSKGVAITCVNWTDWNESGMWVDAQDAFTQKYDLLDIASIDEVSSRPSFERNWMASIETEKGVQALKYALAISDSELVVTPQDLNALIAEQKHFNYREYAKVVDDLELKRSIKANSEIVDFLVGDIEVQLGEIWSNLLGLPLNSRADNFYKSGGDSLLALRMIARIKDQFNIELSLNNLVDTQTFEQLASLIQNISSISSKSDFIPSESRVSEEI